MKFRIWDKRAKQIVESAYGGLGWPDLSEIRLCQNGDLVIESDYGKVILNDENYIVERASEEKDDNDKLIYEGDILKDVYDETYHYGYSPEEAQSKEQTYTVKYQEGRLTIEKKWREHHSIENFKRIVIGHRD